MHPRETANAVACLPSALLWGSMTHLLQIVVLSPCLQTILGISLGADCTLVMTPDARPFPGRLPRPVHIRLPRRSLYVLSGRARCGWCGCGSWDALCWVARRVCRRVVQSCVAVLQEVLCRFGTIPCAFG